MSLLMGFDTASGWSLHSVSLVKFFQNFCPVNGLLPVEIFSEGSMDSKGLSCSFWELLAYTCGLQAGMGFAHLGTLAMSDSFNC